MTEFLTTDVERILERITLEDVYSSEMKLGDRTKRSIFSFDEKPHSKILMSWMVEGYVPFDSDAWKELQQDNISIANDYLASQGEMLIHINKKAPFHIVYCPENLIDYQQLRLRTWFEFFKKYNHRFEISRQLQGKTIFYGYDHVGEYLEEIGVLNDDYIRKLAKKYPEF